MAEDLLLIEHPLSPYAQKVRIMLREKGIGFEMRHPDVDAADTETALPRQGLRAEMPVLRIAESSMLYDSTIILEYLEDAFPSPAMLPQAPLKRAELRAIENVCDTHYEAINWELLELRHFRRGADASGDLRAAAERDIFEMYMWLERRLAGRPWLSGNAFGWADIAAIPHVARSSALGLMVPPGSCLAAWHEHCLERPAVAQTIKEASAELSSVDGAWRLLDGDSRRQYRDHRWVWMVRGGGLSTVTHGVTMGNVRFTDLAAIAGH